MSISRLRRRGRLVEATRLVWLRRGREDALSRTRAPDSRRGKGKGKGKGRGYPSVPRRREGGREFFS